MQVFVLKARGGTSPYPAEAPKWMIGPSSPRKRPDDIAHTVPTNLNAIRPALKNGVLFLRMFLAGAGYKSVMAFVSLLGVRGLICVRSRKTCTPLR